MSNNTIINITCLPPDGVDIPWFELSHGGEDTVEWHNGSAMECTLTFKGGAPFPHSVTIASANDSPQFHARNGPPPPAGCPPGQIYRVYYYSVDCAKGCSFDPGGGMRP
jgi:hypothetical protein